MFELCQTYFKIQGTYFLPSENPFENLLENADKKGSALVQSSLRALETAKCSCQQSTDDCIVRLITGTFGMKDVPTDIFGFR